MYIIEKTEKEVLEVLKANSDKYKAVSEVEKVISHYTREKDRKPIYKYRMKVEKK